MEQAKLALLTEKAREIRIGALTAVYSAASGHPGGSLSIADILSYLYFSEMNVDPKDPKKADRDRLVLSKGHTAPALYRAVEDLPSGGQHSSRSSGYEAYSGCRYDDRFPRTRLFRRERHGAFRQNFGRFLPCLCDSRRRRDGGGADLGGGDVRRAL